MAYRCINFRRICKGSCGKRPINFVLSVRHFVCPNGSILLPAEGLWWNFIFVIFTENCGFARVLDKIRQKEQAFYWIPLYAYDALPYCDLYL
jgi:hypothetical protein